MDRWRGSPGGLNNFSFEPVFRRYAHLIHYLCLYCRLQLYMFSYGAWNGGMGRASRTTVCGVGGKKWITGVGGCVGDMGLIHIFGKERKKFKWWRKSVTSGLSQSRFFFFFFFMLGLLPIPIISSLDPEIIEKECSFI